MVDKKASRRGFLSVVATAVVVGVIAGVGGYYAGLLGTPPTTLTTTRPTTLTTTRPTTLTTTRPTTITTTQTTTVGEPGQVVTTTVTPPRETTTVTQPPVTTTTTVTKTDYGIDMEELIEAAKKEGNLIIYTDLPVSSTDPLAKLFTEKYGIPVDYWRATSGKVSEKFISETRAGTWATDYVSGSIPTYCHNFKMMGLLQPYRSPSEENYEPFLWDPEGYWHSGFASYFVVIGYNTKQVSDAEAPRAWRDLLDPKWKGKIAAGVDPLIGGGWLAIYDMMRRELGIEYLQKLAANEIVKYPSYGPISAALAAGEVPVAVVAHSAVYDQAIAKGAPVKFSIPEEGTVFTQMACSIPRKVPHPNAAKLWIEHTLSLEAVHLYLETRGFFSFHEESPLPPRLEEVNLQQVKTRDEIKLHRSDWLGLPDKMEEYGIEYRSMFGQ